MPEKTVELDGGPSSASQARRRARSALAEWDCSPELIDDVQVVVSELVTNAILHGGGAVLMVLVLQPEAVRVEVGDRSPLRPARSGYGVGASTGRGLGLVAAIARDWGVEPHDDGKLVWAEVPVAPTIADAVGPKPIIPAPLAGGDDMVVCWTGVPVRGYQALQEQNDAVERDVDLLLIGRADGLDSPVPDALLHLCRQLRTRFGRPTSAYRSAVAAAAQRGDERVDLESAMPAGSAAAGRDFVEMFERVEAFAQGGHLLVKPPAPEVRGLRRWFVEEMVAQLAGAPPTRCPW